MPEKTAINLSVVIPLYNEEANVPRLYPVLTEALEGTGISYEIIFVDDGSSDGTGKALEEIHREVSRVVG